MPRRLLAILLSAALAAAPLGAQIIHVPRHGRGGSPSVWVSGSVAYLQQGTVEDGRTQSTWDFGSDVQYRAALEFAIQNYSALGVEASYARLPLSYATASDAVDAHASIRSFGVQFFAGGTPGFHQVIELGAGVTNFADFRADADNRPLPPTSGDTDFSFDVGYGFGYGFAGGASSLFVVQEYAGVVHQHAGLAGNARTLNPQYATRFGVRIGLGARR